MITFFASHNKKTTALQHPITFVLILNSKIKNMKKIFILLFTVFLTTGLFAQDYTYDDVVKYRKQGKFKKALEAVDYLIISDPNQARYYMEKSICQLKLKIYREAMNTLTEGIELMPDSLFLYNSRAIFYRELKSFERAEDDFTEAYKRSKTTEDKVLFLVNRGGNRSDMRDFEGAYKDLMIALELSPNNLGVLNNLAATCSEINKKEESLMYLEKIITIDSTFIGAYVNLGFEYQGLGEHEKALKYFDKAVELAPNEALCYSNRSFSRLETNDLNGAMKDINKSLALYSSNSYAYKIRALIYIEKGKINKACEDLERAHELRYTKQYGNEVLELMNKHCK